MGFDTNDALLRHSAAPLFRLIWWNFIEPEKRATFSKDFYLTLGRSALASFEEKTGEPFPPQFSNMMQNSRATHAAFSSLGSSKISRNMTLRSSPKS